MPRPSPVVALAVLLGTAIAYAGVVHAGVVLDDRTLLTHAGFGDLWGDSGYWRPLLALDFALDRALFGDWLIGWHLHSLAWHLVCTALVLRLAGPVGAALFALHPVQAESVAWLSGRNDPMAATFALAALHFAREDRPALATLAWAAALGCKESVVLWPIVLLAVAPRRKPLAMGVAGTLTLWFGARLALGIHPPEADLALLVPTFPAIVASVALRLVGAFGYFSWHIDYLPLAAWEIVVYGGVVIAGLLALARDRLALGVTLTAAVPALLGIAAYGLVADRYAYLPMVGLALALRALPTHRLVPFGAAAAALLLALLTAGRVADWQDARALFAADHSRRPNCYTAVQLAAATPDPAEVLEIAGPWAGPTCARAVPLAAGAARALGREDLARRFEAPR